MKLISILLIFLSLNIYSQSLQNSIKLYQNGDFQSAITELTKYTEKNKKDYKAYYYLGMCYIMIQDGDKAIENLSLSIQLNKKFADSYNSRGLAYGFVGEVQSSLEDFDRAILLDPKFSEAYINRASAHINLKNNKQAFADFQEAIKLDPKNPTIYFKRAQLYIYEKNLPDAIQDFKQAIKLGFKTEEVYFELGNAYYLSELWDKAIETYTEAIKMNPNYDKAINNRAMSYEKIGKKEKAAKDRATLEKMAGVKFVPFEQIEWIKYISPDSSFSIEVPKNWFYYVIDTTKDRTEILISPIEWDTKSATLLTTINLVMNKNMQALYGVSEPNDLLDFWSGSNAKNSEYYHIYNIHSQKIKMLGNYSSRIYRTTRQVDAQSIMYESYEVSAADDDALFYGYFQSPNNQWKYYEQIFDKAIKTLKFQ